MTILDELGAIEEGEALVRLVLAEALLGSDRRDEARAVIVRGTCAAYSRAPSGSAIRRYRKSFVERVADHARTIELATRLR